MLDDRLGAVPLVLGIVLLASTVRAQSPVRTLDLDEALTLAEKTSERVAIAEAGVARAAAMRAFVNSERWPQLFAAVSYDRTLRSEFEGLFESGTDAGNGNGDGDLDFSNLPFGQANVYRVGLSFSQLLYGGGGVRAQAFQARVAQENARLALTSAQAQNTLDVAEAFYDAALADRLVAIAEETYAQADRSLNVTDEQRSAGRVSEFELLRARVARDTLQPEMVRARNVRELAYLRLKQLLDLPLGEPLLLAAELDAPVLSPPSRFAERLAAAEAAAGEAAMRLAVTQVANDVLVAEEEIAVAGAARKPSISLRSDFGLVNYPESVPELSEWRQNWTVGVVLSLPILDGGRIRASQALARAGADQARAALRLSQELDALDRASTESDLAAALAEWRASLGTIEQAERAYGIAELRYREGLSTQLELSDARLQRVRSQVTRAEAARTLQIRRIRLALLPDLPIATGGLSATGGSPGAALRPANRSQSASAQSGAAGAAGVTGGR